MVFGGDERIRAADLPRAKRSLCQLSYTPGIFTLGTAILSIKKKIIDVPMTINTLYAILPIAHAWLNFLTTKHCCLGNFLKLKPYGGPKSIRTTDLSVISGML